LNIPNDGYLPYEIATDGRRFLVRAAPEKQPGQPLTFIVNWPTLLRKASHAQ
jgi:hypothetical protein